MRPHVETVAFDSPTPAANAYGRAETGWTEVFWSRAEFIYERGREAERAGHLTGSAVFKVKLRSCANARALTTDYRMRDVNNGVAYNVREVDAISDRRFVWIVVESGVAI